MSDADTVIIGSKPVNIYFAPIMFRFEQSTIVNLSAIGANINKMERIVKICKLLGVREHSRRFDKMKNLDVSIVTLERVCGAEGKN